MNFIRTDDDVSAEADLCHLLQFVSSENATDGIVRIAKDEYSGLGDDGFLKGSKIDFVTVSLLNKEWIVQHTAVVDRVPDKMMINGGLKQNALAGSGEDVIG